MANAQQEIKELKQDIANLKNTFADQLDETLANGQSKTILAKDELQRIAGNAGESARAFIDHSKANMASAKYQAEEKIMERPFLSTALAVAGGVVLGSLLLRRK